MFVSAAPTDYQPHEILEFRSWHHRAVWGRRNKGWPLLDLALIPWRAPRSIHRALRVCGAIVAERYGVPLHRQMTQLAWGRARYGLDPSSYYQFQLFRPERWARADRYLQSRDTGVILRWLVQKTRIASGYPYVFLDKRDFDTWCGANGLPSVPAVMEFEHGRPRTVAAEMSLPRADLFSKPTNCQGGFGAMRWLHCGGGQYAGADGRTRSADELVSELARLSVESGRPIVLQRLLRNASAVAGLTAGGLCTARVITMRPPGHEPLVLLGVYRMPAAGAAADNFDRGGLAAPIDLASGQLGYAVRKDPRLLGQPFERHPHTGARIEGQRLPHWPRAVSLVLRAHEAVGWKGVPFVGWDVALLEDGPVLLEGNNVPCTTLSQMPSGIPLGETAFVSCLNAHLRERFARWR